MHMLYAVRHFETEKNLKAIQGLSSYDEITESGLKQANYLFEIINNSRDKNNLSITYFDTPQAKASAKLFSELSQIRLEEPLTLKPFNLGIASGITHEELKKLDIESAISLDLFRNRVIDATKLSVKNAETIEDFEHRLINWWSQEGLKSIMNKIIFGSNSTLVMLMHNPAQSGQ